MRMFAGIAASLILASGGALAASLAQEQEPKIWVSKDGDRIKTVVADVVATDDDDDDDDLLGPKVRKLAVLAGRGAQLGVSVRDLTAEQAKTQTGAVVEEVRTGSAAEKAGVKKGDVITEFDGERVRGVRHLSRLVGETPDGRTVKTGVLRDGKRLDLSVTPDSGAMAGGRDFEVVVPPMRFEGLPGKKFERDLRWDLERSIPKLGPDGFGLKGFFGRGRLGVTVQPLEGQLAEYFGISKGVLVSSVTADSPAAKAGIKAGDVITAVNGKAVTEPSELIEQLRAVDDGASVKIDYTRDRKPQSATATLEKPEPPAELLKRQSARPI
jgi:S1-C subfamily serine protease